MKVILVEKGPDNSLTFKLTPDSPYESTMLGMSSGNIIGAPTISTMTIGSKAVVLIGQMQIQIIEQMQRPEEETNYTAVQATQAQLQSIYPGAKNKTP